MEELRKCPFCGGEAEINDRGFFTTETFVECMECLARGEEFYTEAEAIAAWNRRVEG